MDSSLVLNFVIEFCVVEASSCRASVRDSSIGPDKVLAGTVCEGGDAGDDVGRIGESLNCD